MCFRQSTISLARDVCAHPLPGLDGTVNAAHSVNPCPARETSAPVPPAGSGSGGPHTRARAAALAAPAGPQPHTAPTDPSGVMQGLLINYHTLNIRNVTSRKLDCVTRHVRAHQPDLMLIVEAGPAAGTLNTLHPAEPPIELHGDSHNSGMSVLNFSPHISVSGVASGADRRWLLLHVRPAAQPPNPERNNGAHSPSSGTPGGTHATQAHGGWFVLCTHAPCDGDRADWWHALHTSMLTAIPAGAPILLMGDLNVHLSPLDKSTPISSAERSRAFAASQLMHDWSLTDVARHLHPEARMYTYHRSHDSYGARLDLCAASPGLLAGAIDSSVIPFPHSDHDAVAFRFSHACGPPSPIVPPERRPAPPLPGDLFKIPSVKEALHQFLTDYASANPHTDLTGQALYAYWSALKAALATEAESLRQQQSVATRTVVMSAQLSLEQATAALAAQHTPATHQAYVQARANMKSALDAHFALRTWTKRKAWYNEQERPNPSITAQLRGPPDGAIHCIDAPGGPTTDPTHIANAFRTHLSTLYTPASPGPTTQPDQAFMLSKLSRRLSAADGSALNAAFQLEELNSARRKLPRHRAPGPDRLPYELYTTQWQHIKDILLRIANHTANTGECPADMLHCTMVVKHKPMSGSKALCRNYRPLSLSNADYKIIAKVMASRTGRVLTRIIHPDQTGFVPGRRISHNILTMQWLTELSKQLNRPLVTLFCDVAKAYDTADRAFIRMVLETLNFPPSYVNVFTAFHTRTSAQVMVNGALSDPFPTMCGVRQGCPWAPMLFILMAETLAEAVRVDPAIPPFQFGPGEGDIINLTSYADDNTLITCSAAGVTAFLALAKRYGNASGNHIGPNKSKLYINGARSSTIQALQRALPDTPIITPDGAYTYLGTPLGADSTDFWQSVAAEVKRRMVLLNRLRMTTFGRAQTARSYALSKALFALTYTAMDPTMFKHMHWMYRNFVLNHKVAVPHPGTECYRMGVRDACLHPKHGGIGMLHLPTYVQSMRFSTICHILQCPDSPVFRCMSALCKVATAPWRIDHAALLWSAAPIRSLLKQHSPSLHMMSEYVEQTPPHRCSLFINTAVLLNEPLFGNPLFPELSDMRARDTRLAAEAGFTHARDMLVTTTGPGGRITASLAPDLRWVACTRHLPNPFGLLRRIKQALRPVLTILTPRARPMGTSSVHGMWVDSWEWPALPPHSAPPAPKVTITKSWDSKVSVTKALFTYACTPHMPNSPRFGRNWAHLLGDELGTIDHTFFKTYRDIWKLSLPRPLIEMTFQLLNDSLPTGTKFTTRRGAPDTSCCPYCEEDHDSLPHTLVDCELASHAWRWAIPILSAWLQGQAQLTYPPPMPWGARFSFSAWLAHTISQPDDWTFLLWSSVVFQALWKSRLSVRATGIGWTMRRIQQFCISTWLDAAMLMSETVHPGCFAPIISIDPSSHSATWSYSPPAGGGE